MKAKRIIILEMDKDECNQVLRQMSAIKRVREQLTQPDADSLSASKRLEEALEELKPFVGALGYA